MDRQHDRRWCVLSASTAVQMHTEGGRRTEGSETSIWDQVINLDFLVKVWFLVSGYKINDFWPVVGQSLMFGQRFQNQ